MNPLFAWHESPVWRLHEDAVRKGLRARKAPRLPAVYGKDEFFEATALSDITDHGCEVFSELTYGRQGWCYTVQSYPTGGDGCFTTVREVEWMDEVWEETFNFDSTHWYDFLPKAMQEALNVELLARLLLDEGVDLEAWRKDSGDDSALSEEIRMEVAENPVWMAHREVIVAALLEGRCPRLPAAYGTYQERSQQTSVPGNVWDQDNEAVYSEDGWRLTEITYDPCVTDNDRRLIERIEAKREAATFRELDLSGLLVGFEPLDHELLLKRLSPERRMAVEFEDFIAELKRLKLKL